MGLVALLQFPGVLGRELLGVGVQNHDDRQTVLRGVPVLRIDLLVVILIHVNHNDHIIALESGGDAFVRLVERVQFVAPAAPIGPELQENPFL